MKQVICLILSLIILTVNFTGCANQTAKVGSSAQGITKADESSNTLSITDMAGRKVTIPKEVKKVYATSLIGVITVYTINPDKISGWTNPLSDEVKKYMPSQYANLPVLGGVSVKKGTVSNEELLKVHPDIIISMSTIDSSVIDEANTIEQQLNIPVVVVDGTLAKLDKAYEFLGSILGEGTKAKELSGYCNKSLNDIKEQVEKIPEDKRVRVYYAEGIKGLNTDPKGSFHTEVLDFVKGINVAQIPIGTGNGRSEVSMEQVLNWSPEMIIVCHEESEMSGGGNGGGGPKNTGEAAKGMKGNSKSFYDSIYEDENWQDIKAVKEKKVYEVPELPFNWFDRPPSVNRIIGIKWLANLLYPDKVKLDMTTEVKEFYDKFYHIKLTEEQVKELLKKAK